MRKNENPNFINVRPEGIPWKLGFFFLWGFLLFSNPLFAFGETDSSELADSIHTDKEAQAEAVLYIQKGAFVYGMENITQTITNSPATEKSTPKTFPKKKKTTVKKKEAKQKAEPKLPEPEISVVLSTHPSEEFFSLGKNTSAVATITVHQTLKLAVKTHITEVLIVPFLNTNPPHSYVPSFIKDIFGERILTRPPPYLI
ncbi:hypothetical protein MKS83_01400 [Chryseobacterium sp. Y16C]|uniref:hypothetical protein n=1 Tax=Chryseobacterium sp. Y16C TaxID=2920939 RepID=UPI001F0AF16B|nr:hypothetical protein [Chryseobacterium sp. Y16C]UMQ42354.1 hypothetical protein MKS83_01400 [Chryseobacterium sp. Y16C]